MGRRGPAPAPAKVRIARGEDHLARLNLVEPIAPAGPLEPPEGLSGRRLELWRDTVRLAPAGVLAPIDSAILLCYVDAVVRFEANSALLATLQPLLRSERSDRAPLIRNPLAQIVRDDAEQVRLFARELGFSPSARANLRLDSATTEANVWDDVGLPPRLAVLRGK